MEEGILLSIKTRYANNIFNGTKKYEYRRKSIGYKNCNKKIYVYSSEEDKAIIGYIIIDEIISGDIDFIIKTTDASYEIKKYFDGCDKGYALKIGKIFKFNDPVYLKDIKIYDNKFNVPQFYRYIKKDEYIYKLLINKINEKKIDNINNYINDKDMFDELSNEIYNLTSFLGKTYINYKKWFYDKQINGCLEGKGNIFFIKNENNNIVAAFCVKNDLDEKKICTLYVDSNYRNMGYGSILFDKCFEYLGTNKPLITINKKHLSYFKYIINKYDFNLTNIIDNEYYFNENM